MTMLLSWMLATAPVMAAPIPAMPTDLGSVPVIEGWLGRKVSPRWSDNVARLYRRGECHGAVDHEGSQLLEIDMLFLVAGDGTPVKIAPVNLQCPAVETFVSERVLGTLRHSFPRDGGTQPRWMRSQVRFLWSDAP